VGYTRRRGALSIFPFKNRWLDRIRDGAPESLTGSFRGLSRRDSVRNRARLRSRLEWT